MRGVMFSSVFMRSALHSIIAVIIMTFENHPLNSIKAVVKLGT